MSTLQPSLANDSVTSKYYEALMYRPMNSEKFTHTLTVIKLPCTSAWDSVCNGQVKPDTFLSHFLIKFPLKI
jgi:hypothetical protein